MPTCRVGWVPLATRESAPHIVLSGDLDLAVASELRDAGAAVAKAVAPGRLEMDLSDVTFIDSSGLGALVAVHNYAKELGSTLVLLRAGPIVARFFELAGVRDYFNIE